MVQAVLTWLSMPLLASARQNVGNARRGRKMKLKRVSIRQWGCLVRASGDGDAGSSAEVREGQAGAEERLQELQAPGLELTVKLLSGLDEARLEALSVRQAATVAPPEMRGAVAAKDLAGVMGIGGCRRSVASGCLQAPSMVFCIRFIAARSVLCSAVQVRTRGSVPFGKSFRAPRSSMQFTRFSPELSTSLPVGYKFFKERLLAKGAGQWVHRSPEALEAEFEAAAAAADAKTKEWREEFGGLVLRGKWVGISTAVWAASALGLTKDEACWQDCPGNPDYSDLNRAMGTPWHKATTVLDSCAS